MRIGIGRIIVRGICSTDVDSPYIRRREDSLNPQYGILRNTPEDQNCGAPTKKFTLHVAIVASLFVLSSLIMGTEENRAMAVDSIDTPNERYVTQMDMCQPQHALSDRMEQGKWQLITYETEELKGTMVGALSLINAPDLTIPLDATGWHKVYIGYWNPSHLYEDDPIIKVRLSDQPVFRIYHEDVSADRQDSTYLREAFFDYADLTGRDLVIGKSNGILGKQMFFAYVKLVPMSAEEVDRVVKDRADTSTRKLAVSIDGASYLHLCEFSTPNDILALVEPYRNSDVGRIFWAVCYGALTNYPTSVKGAQFRTEGSWANLLDQAYRDRDHGITSRHRGEKQTLNTLRTLTARGIIPQQLAADYVHSMEVGIKFDLMFRMGILGNVPRQPDRGDFVSQHPEYRQVHRDGTVIEKASYAFPEVQGLMLNLIREATTLIDADGINLCYTRGPRFLSYEQPILDAFTNKYGEDARAVDPADPRLLEIRAGIMTDFMHKVRQTLDEVGAEKGKRLELSIWAWPHDQPVWLGERPIDEGLEIRAWIQAGLLDSVVSRGRDPENGIYGIDSDYISLGKAHNCTFILADGEYMHAHGEERRRHWFSAAYEAGVEYFAYWDADFAQINPELWAWLRRMGHQEEQLNWNREEHQIKSIQLHTIDGIDVLNGLSQAVYSGG